MLKHNRYNKKTSFFQRERKAIMLLSTILQIKKRSLFLSMKLRGTQKFLQSTCMNIVNYDIFFVIGIIIFAIKYINCCIFFILLDLLLNIYGLFIMLYYNINYDDIPIITNTLVILSYAFTYIFLVIIIRIFYKI